jgi:hypothetical protein
MDNKIEIDQSSLPEFRDKLMKCKTIALSEIGKHPLTNPKYLSNSDKNEVLIKTRDMLDLMSLDEINKKFNNVCNEKLFCSDVDYSQYSVYVDRRVEIQQKIFDSEEEVFQRLKEELKVNKLIENN